jgi:hypothetical protein
MKLGGLRATSPSCRTYLARLDDAAVVRPIAVPWTVFDLPSVTTDPNEANWGRLPTRTYAVIPITPMVPVPSVPVIVIVITDIVMTVMVVIAPMFLVMIVAFRVALILIVLVMVIIAFSSEGRYGK